MKVKLDNGAYKPRREHQTDAGLDIRAKEGQIVPANGSAVFRTGVHIQLRPGTCGILKSKSGLNVNHDIISTGLIDEGYTGEIVVKLHNLGKEDYEVKAGDKISQLIVVPCIYEYIELVECLDDSERGSNGFGSTGR